MVYKKEGKYEKSGKDVASRMIWRQQLLWSSGIYANVYINLGCKELITTKIRWIERRCVFSLIGF
jgi:hypothetical protein